MNVAPFDVTTCWLQGVLGSLSVPLTEPVNLNEV